MWKRCLLLLLLCSCGCSIWPRPTDVTMLDTRGREITATRVGESVAFTCRRFDPLAIHAFKWDFGDGEITEWVAGSVAHVYKQPGVFRVRVRERCPTWTGPVCVVNTPFSAPLVIRVDK